MTPPSSVDHSPTIVPLLSKRNILLSQQQQAPIVTHNLHLSLLTIHLSRHVNREQIRCGKSPPRPVALNIPNLGGAGGWEKWAEGGELIKRRIPPSTSASQLQKILYQIWNWEIDEQLGNSWVDASRCMWKPICWSPREIWEKWASHHCQRFVRFVPCTFQPTVVHQRKGIQLHEATIWRASETYPLCLFAWWSYLFGNQTWVAFLCLFNSYICLFAAFLCRLLHILLPTLLLEVTFRSHKNSPKPWHDV